LQALDHKGYKGSRSMIRFNTA